MTLTITSNHLNNLITLETEARALVEALEVLPFTARNWRVLEKAICRALRRWEAIDFYLERIQA